MSPSQPLPVPPGTSVIHFPADHYCHPDAPTEWWWHTGTLTAGERVFGFVINAASFAPAGFTQIMLTDVVNNQHFQNTTMQSLTGWAESDPSKDWYVKLGSPGGAQGGILGDDECGAGRSDAEHGDQRLIDGCGNWHCRSLCPNDVAGRSAVHRMG